MTATLQALLQQGWTQGPSTGALSLSHDPVGHLSGSGGAQTCKLKGLSCDAGALQALAALLYSSDRAVLQLLHVLKWQPVLQQIAPVIHHLQASDAATPASSLMDTDLPTGAQSAPAESAAAQGLGSKLQGTKSLDPSAKAWAAHLMLLLLPAYIMKAQADLPAWLQRLISHEPGSPDSGESQLQLQQQLLAHACAKHASMLVLLLLTTDASCRHCSMISWSHSARSCQHAHVMAGL